MEAGTEGQSQPPLALWKRPREQSSEDDNESCMPKRSRRTSLPSPPQTQRELRHEDYTVAWVSALPIEMAAAKAMLDNVHRPLSMNPNDSNVYVFGDIGSHNVVIACLPSGQYGITKAAIVANNMRWSFPSISIRLMVGIGGGVPSTADIRLGDVVVSNPTPASSGVIQYDFGKTVQEGRFQHTGVLNKPPQELLAGVARLRADHETRPSSMEAILSEMSQRNPSMTAYSHQGSEHDRLYKASYDHNGNSYDHCDLSCDPSQRVQRPARSSSLPRIHYGVIASANQVTKHGETRDRIAKEHNVLCFEMEAAGLMDSFPCLVIRGICDYSDSHKAKQWQQYAAATAAAYAKELLSVMPSQEGQGSASTVVPRPADTISAEGKRKAILETLRFDRIDNRHANIRAAHAKTCQWLSKHPHYKSWLDPKKFSEHHGFLWISGKPGAGKSTIMKHAFTRAKRKTATNAAVISFFFNARGEDLEKTTIGMHRSLLLQLLENLPELKLILDDVNHNIQHDALASDLNLLRDLFSKAISSLGQQQVTCFIDALDECDENEVRQMLYFFEDLGQCAVQNNIKLYTCFSSRHYPHMDIQYGLKLTLEDQPGHANDMEEYVRTKLKTGAKKPGNDLVAEILQKASGVFMWIVLVVDILNKEFSRGRLFAVKKRLKEVPRGLSALFEDILTRDNENMEDLLLCVQWVLFGNRPLTREEYYYALAAGLDPESLGEWDSEEVTEEAMDIFIVSSSKGLAEVTKTKKPTVQFIHESVRDFLLKDDGFRSLWPQLGDNVEHSSHDSLKNCCYAYTKVKISSNYWPDDDEFLLKVPSKTAKSTRSLVAEKFPFLEYATSQLLQHANAAAKGLSQSEFLQEFSRDLQLQRWIKFNNLFETYKVRRYKPCPSLQYIFAEHDCGSLIETAASLGLGQATGLTSTKERYSSPLFAAIYKKRQNALRSLLHCSTEEDIKQRDEHGRTPAVVAAIEGHGDAVEMLLHAGADADALNQSLIGALVNEHWQVAEFLLLKGIRNPPTPTGSFSTAKQTTDSPSLVFTLTPEDLDRKDPGGNTLLMQALKRGEFVIAGLLIDVGANIHVADVLGNSVLHLSCKEYPLGYGRTGSEEQIITLCKKLHQHGIDVNCRNRSGQTPLHCALQASVMALSKLLLELGADINATDNEERTPLFLSLQEGSLEISKMLMAEHAQIQLYDKEMKSPLSYIKKMRDRDHMDLILQLGVDIDAKDQNGETALFHACANSRGKVAECLIESGADVNIVNKENANALFKVRSFSYGESHGNFVRMFLEAGIDLATVNSTGQTILHIASSWWIHDDGDEMLRLIQKALQVGHSINSKDQYGQTPLMIAAGHLQEKTAALLLQRGADPNMESNKDRTPLIMAIENRIGSENRVGICRLLLENGADAAKVTRNGDTAMAAAKRKENHEVEELLSVWISKREIDGS